MFGESPFAGYITECDLPHVVSGAMERFTIGQQWVLRWSQSVHIIDLSGGGVSEEFAV